MKVYDEKNGMEHEERKTENTNYLTQELNTRTTAKHKLSNNDFQEELN